MDNSNKVMPLKEAIDCFVHNGAHISLGGFTINRNPMASVYEIIRQKKKNLHLYAHSNGQAVDELIGGNCVKNIEIAYSGTGLFASTCIRFKKAVETGTVQVEDYSNYHMVLRFLAGSMGIPFMPTKTGFNTDILRKWGFSKKKRISSKRMPNKKFKLIDNPFGDWFSSKQLILVPAIRTDIAIIHVQQSDRSGLSNIQGLPFADVEQAKASDKVIITCEELVDTKILRNHADSNQIPSFIVEAVVPVKYGAYPTACYNYYDYDPQFFRKYSKKALIDLEHEAYIRDFILKSKNHTDFLELVTEGQIDTINADLKTGYSTGMNRK